MTVDCDFGALVSAAFSKECAAGIKRAEVSSVVGQEIRIPHLRISKQKNVAGLVCHYVHSDDGQADFVEQTPFPLSVCMP